jgi:hypothetical protein
MATRLLTQCTLLPRYSADPTPPSPPTPFSWPHGTLPLMLQVHAGMRQPARLVLPL